MTAQSQIERRVEKDGLELDHIDFGYSFTDKKGVSFTGKCDGKIGDDIYLEYKGDKPLNNKTSVQSSRNALQGQIQWRMPGYPNINHLSHTRASGVLWSSGFYNDCLDYGWNHSMVAKAIIAKELKKHGKRLIIIFETHPPTIDWHNKQIPFQQFYLQRFGLETYTYEQWKNRVRPKVLAEQKKAQPIRKPQRKAARRGIFRKAA